MNGTCLLADAWMAWMKCVEKQGFVAMLKARNLDVSFAESDEKGAAPAPAAGGHGAPAAGAKPGASAAKPAVAAKK